MNNDLISREALKEALHNFFDGKVIDEPAYILRDVFCHIDNAPTVETDIEVATKDAYDHGYTDGWKERFGEPDERPQGEWIYERPNGKTYSDFVFCSVCHENNKFYKSNFCPNCGAKMKG